MIRLDRLSKSFRGRPALHDLSLQVERGEIFGLLGHNGAGKSTTFGLILGHLHPDSGDAYVGDVSVQQDRLGALKRVGAIFETPAFYDYLSGWRNLTILTALSGGTAPEEIREAVELVDLTARIHDPVRTYSHGMRQRLALAQALVPAPDVVLLDEPTEGLDPEGIHEIRNLILRLNRERGLTVLLSSHLLSEVELLCERVAILNHGRLIHSGPWKALRGDRRYRIEVSDPQVLETRCREAGIHCSAPGVVQLGDDDDIADLVDWLVRNGVRVRAVEPIHLSLEQLYLERVTER